MSIKIITTEDGSNSLYDEDLNETYHSTRGARGESMHVFIREGLDHWLAGNTTDELCVLEVGLGTGLNAFLTAQFATKTKQKIRFVSLEPFPIDASIYSNLNFHQSDEEKELLMHIHACAWEQPIPLSEFFTLQKAKQKLEDFELQESFDVIFFDAFAPSKQPEVWSVDNLNKCLNALNPGGILTTYCAQGKFKRNLMEVGFEVETLQGAMGKKEMVRGIRR